MKIAVVSFDTSGPDSELHAIIRLCISIVEFHSCEILEEFSSPILFQQERAVSEYLTSAGYTPEIWKSDAENPKSVSEDASEFLRENGTIQKGDLLVSRIAVFDRPKVEFLTRWFGRLGHTSLPFVTDSPAFEVRQFVLWQHEIYPHHSKPLEWTTQGLSDHFTADAGPKLVGAAMEQSAIISILGAAKSMTH